MPRLVPKNIECKKCGNYVLQLYTDGKIKLRSKIIIFNDDGTSTAVCKCGKEIYVPVVLSYAPKHTAHYIVLDA